MRTNASWLSGIILTVALALAFAGAPLAQTTSTTDVRNFEVISVDGNKLVVRDERGTQEITVPDDFRFTVDGKKMAVSELKAGMKGTATVTTTTTTKPVFVTELREGEVLRASPISVPYAHPMVPPASSPKPSWTPKVSGSTRKRMHPRCACPISRRATSCRQRSSPTARLSS